MKTSVERYKENRAQIDAKIKELQTLLKQFDKAQKKQEFNWGYVGSANYLLEQLSNAVNHLK